MRRWLSSRAIRDVLRGGEAKSVSVNGWVRSVRRQKHVCFLEVNDGSCAGNLQVVANVDAVGREIGSGASVTATGAVVKGPKALELQASEVELVGPCGADYPLQKKEHSEEFLREHIHLRPRTASFAAVLRVRSLAAHALHAHLQGEGFVEVNAPILVSGDCEGAGELFAVHDQRGKEFFGPKTYLTVSAQLHGEAFACALSRVYVFGPTFRAEKRSKTSHHLAEFWMLEPEAAFLDLEGALALAESTVRGGAQAVLDRGAEELRVIASRTPEELSGFVRGPFGRMTYTEAIAALNKSGTSVAWGADLQREHERWLCEKHNNGRPLFVTDYPKSIKPFYAKASGGGGSGGEVSPGPTVQAFDLLVPGIGELVGGSVREDNYGVLCNSLDERGMDRASYEWYLDLRKYGSVPHAGFGMGFERFLQFCTGVQNIRDVTPVPRWTGHIRL